MNVCGVSDVTRMDSDRLRRIVSYRTYVIALCRTVTDYGLLVCEMKQAREV